MFAPRLPPVTVGNYFTASTGVRYEQYRDK
jgi:hypothetical protein